MNLFYKIITNIGYEILCIINTPVAAADHQQKLIMMMMISVATEQRLLMKLAVEL